MKIYLDKELTKEIQNFDLGIVLAGDAEEYIFYVYNETEAELVNMFFTIDNNEVEIRRYPSFMLSKETAELVIAWKASITLKKGLHAILSVKGEELYK